MTSIAENTIIRRAAFEDLKEVYTIEKGAFGKGAYPTIVYLNSLLSFPSLFLVAEFDGQIIGFLATRLKEDTKSILIESLAVKEEYRRQNIGTKLLLEVIEVAPKLGYNDIYVTINPENSVAASLFRKCGFFEVRRFKLPDRCAVELKLPTNVQSSVEVSTEECESFSSGSIPDSGPKER